MYLFGKGLKLQEIGSYSLSKVENCNDSLPSSQVIGGRIKGSHTV